MGNGGLLDKVLDANAAQTDGIFPVPRLMREGLMAIPVRPCPPSLPTPVAVLSAVLLSATLPLPDVGMSIYHSQPL